MSEKAPNGEQKNIFNILLMMVHPDRIITSAGVRSENIEMINNTAGAFSLIRQYFKEFGKMPDSWEFLGVEAGSESRSGFDSQTKFMFVQIDRGLVIKEQFKSFISPAAFFIELRKFHELDASLTKEETTAAELERRAAEARALRLEREARNNSSIPVDIPQPKTTTSPFKFRK